MTEEHDNRLTSHQPGLYEIRVQGSIPASRTSWFEGMSISSDENGQTTLRGEVIDQSALHGLLNKIRDLNIPLLSVTYISDL